MSHGVLVIDDSATVRKLVEISLRGRALRPYFAETGREGIRSATTLAPAAILLDFVLPDMTGIEVCRALAADARTRSIPILVVTAKHERTRSEFQPFPSVIDFVAKPFVAPDLIARIERAIAGSARPTAAPAAVTTLLATIATTPIPTVQTPAMPAAPAAQRRDPVERAAKLLFTRLRDGLALLPSQLHTLEAGPIAPQLARRLLTPQVVEGILADLRPLCAELADAEAAARGPGSATDPVATEAVIDRAPGFTARIQTAQLSSLDRRILAQADGRTSIGEIARRLASEPGPVETAVRGLIASGLVHETQGGPRPRPVVICDPDIEAFHEPLRSLLARRPTPRELIAVDRVEQIVGATRERQPCLVMVNATSRVAESCAVAQALRADLALSDVAVIAVLEARVGRPPDLLAAGFDAVLAKPVMLHELERFLTPADPR
jgi:CheY-like chemotaxis protein